MARPALTAHAHVGQAGVFIVTQWLRPVRVLQAWEAFVAVRDDARRALEAAVGAAASAFQQRLAGDDAGCGEDLAALDDDRVMRLTEQEVHQVGCDGVYGGGGFGMGRGGEPEGTSITRLAEHGLHQEGCRDQDCWVVGAVGLSTVLRIGRAAHQEGGTISPYECGPCVQVDTAGSSTFLANACCPHRLPLAPRCAGVGLRGAAHPAAGPLGGGVRCGAGGGGGAAAGGEQQGAERFGGRGQLPRGGSALC